MFTIIVALLVDGAANLFWWIGRWIVMFPITLITRYRKKKIMEGVEITHAILEVIRDTYPYINIHLHMESRTTANLKVKSLILCLRSAQWELPKVYATPVLDNIPAVIKGRGPTEFNLRFDAPLKWWLESPSNMNISKAILEATTSWGDLNWPIKIGQCSMDIKGINGVRNDYLFRIGLKKSKKGETP